MKMNRYMGKNCLIVLFFTGLFMTACATYYKVTDPVTGSVYYTEEVKREGSAAMFKDARSGAEVTIQNSEIKEVEKKEYNKGLVAPASKPTAVPAPAPPPAPAPAPPAPEPAPAPETP